MDQRSVKPQEPAPSPPRANAPRDAGIHLVGDAPAEEPVVAASPSETRPPPPTGDTVAFVQGPAARPAQAPNAPAPRATARTTPQALQETGAFVEPSPTTRGSASPATGGPSPRGLDETGAFVEDPVQDTSGPRKQSTAVPPKPQTTSAPAKPAAKAGALAGPPGGKLTALGDFKLVGKLGAGGMGVVYKARQVSLDRDVALKVLAKHLSENADYVARFQREAKLMARLEHPNVLRCYAVGTEYGFHYFAMEFVDGASFESWLKKFGKFSVGDALHVILKCADALQYAHEQGLVHRDIKPDNLLLTKKGVVKVADLGLAKATADDVGLTRTGTGAGTPLYMSPEQARDAKHVDCRADIYSMGCMLYAFLTGRTPFGGETYVEVIENKMKGKYPPARRANDQIPPRLDLIIDKMMVVNPEQRYQTCAEIIKDLEALGLANRTLSFVEGNPGAAVAAAPSAPPARVPTGPTHVDAKTAGTKPQTPAGPPEEGPDIWYVNFKNAKGTMVTKKMTTSQIVDLIRDDRLDEKDRASKSMKDNFRSLAVFREFEHVLKHKIVQERADRKAAKFQGVYEKLVQEHDRYQRWKWLKNKMYSTGGFLGLLLWLAVIAGVGYGGYLVFTKWVLQYILELFHLKPH